MVKIFMNNVTILAIVGKIRAFVYFIPTDYNNLNFVCGYGLWAPLFLCFSFGKNYGIIVCCISYRWNLWWLTLQFESIPGIQMIIFIGECLGNQPYDTN